MFKLLLLLFVFGVCGALSAEEGKGTVGSLVVVQGAGGEDEFGKLFSDWVEQWMEVGERGEMDVFVVGRKQGGILNEGSTDRDLLITRLEEESETGPPLWVVLIGHGTYDRRDAKFNLVGPDVSASELDGWLSRFSRTVVIINAASASGPFLDRLSRKGRIVVTATKSGSELQFARFGGYLAGAIGSSKGDLDKDGQVSLLEAFLLASKLTQEFYSTEGRLSTEHALMDDNADGKGTRSEFFKGVRAVKKPQGGASLDGALAHQIHVVLGEFEQTMSQALRDRRNELERRVFRLRERKPKLKDEEYYQQLEELMVEIGAIYQEAEKAKQASGS
ncbi:hypothetical protein N9B94_03900 [Verrucomicrobia bacterium]|nr:hypothetical protein [Verrucomicrobiota bacterium]